MLYTNRTLNCHQESQVHRTLYSVPVPQSDVLTIMFTGVQYTLIGDQLYYCNAPLYIEHAVVDVTKKHNI